MTDTQVDIDQNACAEIMRRYQLATQGEAVNLALRMLVAGPLSLEIAKLLRGSGWNGDLNEMRDTRKTIIKHLAGMPDIGDNEDFVRK